MVNIFLNTILSYVWYVVVFESRQLVNFCEAENSIMPLFGSAVKQDVYKYIVIVVPLKASHHKYGLIDNMSDENSFTCYVL